MNTFYAVTSFVVSLFCASKFWFNKLIKIVEPVVEDVEHMALDGKIDRDDRKAIAMRLVSEMEYQGIIKLSKFQKFFIKLAINYIAKKLPDFDVVQFQKSGTKSALRKFAWKKDEVDARDYTFDVVKSSKLPDTVDLRQYCSKIEDQGAMGSCGANAGVGALELLGISDMERAELSRLFVYYNARAMRGRQNEDSGVFIRDVVKVLAKSGACTERLWAYNTVNLFKKPSEVCYEDAHSRKISFYERISTTNAIKMALSQGCPVIFGIQLYVSFNKVGASGIVKCPGWFEPALGGHAMLIVGYKKIGRRWHFIVRNSWGESWGDKGYCYIPFSYVAGRGDDFWLIRGGR